MASPFQAASLVACPSYPNSIAWSEENLIAVASGHIVTILNPNSLCGPRGLVNLLPIRSFPIGVVNREDLLASCLIPTCLSRDTRPCVRSISWSPIGLAPNGGCLLAVCTREGRVKIYRSPYLEFSIEWVEILDVSDILCNHLQTINFGELDRSCASFSQVHEITSEKFTKKKTRLQSSSVCESGGRVFKKMKQHGGLPLITPQQYSTRSAMLSSLVVSWSPILQIPYGEDPYPVNCPSIDRFSVLAVGGKAGNLSLWRINDPQCYTIEHDQVSLEANLIGFLQAHDSWITAISWGTCAATDLKFHLILTTGCSDGSVKLWLGDVEVLIKSSSKVNGACFSLLKEVIAVGAHPISAVSLAVPEKSLHKILLAVGKGSGSLEVWTCNTSINDFQMAAVSDAHDQVVTGLAWAFDGRLLYSCGQDNSFRSWILNGRTLCDVPFSSNVSKLKLTNDLPQAFDSCFGLVLSPGNLIVAVVRGFDPDLLNPMYQAKAQKAAVEFFWTSGQALEILSHIYPDYDSQASTNLSGKDSVFWEPNILWSLRQYEHVDKPLVLWDAISALRVLQQCAPNDVERLVLEWFSSWTSCSGSGLSLKKFLVSAPIWLSKLTLRQLHLLNIICRCLKITEVEENTLKGRESEIGRTNGGKHDKLNLWNELLIRSEREVRERLVAFTFKAFLAQASVSVTKFPMGEFWPLVGIAQMECWVSINHGLINNQLEILGSEVGKLRKRLCTASECQDEEKCSFCSASVPFESPELAYCEGTEHNVEVGRTHKLSRCSVSMQVLPITPQWFCVCCQRWSAKLFPVAFFTSSGSPLDVEYEVEHRALPVRSKPLCPFCGILLQRLQPDFLLSAWPV
ncbi:hypothetical protein QJS10_CPA07g01109 [Acorus calamus]|uniref:Transcription factor IIIC 90kDa subunit N-terminal domain-containing protein n=1 Tax=Acorus calamus TaxID=4465 RepID=A0AAV9ED31_ACOCL|nr:hypothetical protein QJS10_CPA07g01109 [Acorus calamus]